MQIICTSLQTDKHTSTLPLSILQAVCPSCRPTNSVKALKDINCNTVNTFKTLVTHFAWVVDDAKCIVVTAVCVLYVCLSVCPSPHSHTILHGPGCNLGQCRGYPLIVHYWADFQSMPGFRCYDKIARTRNVSERLYSLYAWFHLYCNRKQM